MLRSSAATAVKPSGQTVTSCPMRGSSRLMQLLQRPLRRRRTGSSERRTGRSWKSWPSYRDSLLDGVQAAFGMVSVKSATGDTRRGREAMGGNRRNAAAFVRRGNGRTTCSATSSGALARRLDAAAMFLNDAVRDRHAQAGSLAVAAAREERFEEVLEHFGSHAAAVVGDAPARPGRRGASTSTRTVPPGSRLSRALVSRLSTTCLISCELTRAITGSAAANSTCFSRYLPSVPDHLDHAVHEFAQVGRMPFHVAQAGEVEQLLGDSLAAERLVLD